MACAQADTGEFARFLALRHAPAGFETTMVGATVSRLLKVIGFLTGATLARMSPPKVIEAVGPYGFGLAPTVALFL